ncbi:MAG: HEPN domain-containing protein [Planctomycetes bacterium]|nr:HEPN domain-containing protein [Planctomycetota bacterium]
MRSPRDHAQMLLDKAANDLVAARATVATGEALDTVCFHAQQAVEKSLKALLALKDVEFPWHHDLGELLILVQSHYQNLSMPEDGLLSLTPYAVQMRYDDHWIPEIEETQQALNLAEEVHAQVRRIVDSD